MSPVHSFPPHFSKTHSNVILPSVKEGEMGGACSTQEYEKCIQNLLENLKERDQLGDLGIAGWITLKMIPEEMDVGQVHVAQDRMQQ
jgi:hypothetical protein